MLQHQQEPLVPRGGGLPTAPAPLGNHPPRLWPPMGWGTMAGPMAGAAAAALLEAWSPAGLPVPAWDTRPAPVSPHCWFPGATSAPAGAWPRAGDAGTERAARAEALAVTTRPPQQKGRSRGHRDTSPNTRRCPG